MTTKNVNELCINHLDCSIPGAMKEKNAAAVAAAAEQQQ